MKSIQTLLTAIHAQKVRLNRFRRSSFALLMAFSIVAPDVLALSVTIQNRLSPISLETEGVLMTGTVKINEEPVEEFRYPMFLDAESAPEVPVTNYSVYAEGIALIGVSKNDPTNNPSDDVFTLQIQEKLEEDYILSYEVYGIASGASIPKSVNYGSTYREGRLEASQNWSTAHERILSDDVKVGENKIHFTLPSRLNAGAKVQNVRITPVSKFEGQAPEMTSFKPLQLDRRGFFNLGGALHFSVAALDADDMPSFGTDKFNVTMGADGYRLLTTGPSAFGLGEAAAFISLQIDKDRLPAGTGLDEVRLYYFDRQMNQWAIVPGCRFDEATQSMMAPSVGETDYVAGVLQNPEMPQASGFVPTSISGLDAANPAAGMNLMQPPTANASGAANISYPLEIPAGRNGMQPSLALTYSNEGGSSWVGYGWNLSAPSISIDTRWGVPRFDPNYETELYSYGGNHLVYPGNYLPHRTFTEYNDSTGAPMYARTSGTVRFFEQNTRSYKTIERKGTSTSGYFWVITDSEGTKQYYGTTDGTSQDAGSVLKNAQGHAVDWKLTKVIDKWGNYMTYEYISKSYTSTGNNIVDGSTALILKKITYTGHGTDIGKYSVEFKLKSWSGSNYRMDGRVSNRLGSAHADIETLDKVVVQYNGTEVKHYQLGYTQGAFYKNLLTQITETRNGSVFTTHELDYYDLPGVVYTDTVSSDQRINTDLKVPLSILPTRDLLALGLSPGSRSYYTGMSPIGSSSNAGFNFQGRYGIGPSFKLTQQEMDDISEAMESLYGSDMAEQLTKDWSRAILTFTADNSNSGTFGAFLSYGMNGTKGMVSMQDVDGDGLSDIVRKVGSKLYVRKLYRDSTLTMRYGPEQLLNTNMTVMGKSRSSNLSFGIDYHSPKLKKLKLLEFSLGLTLNKNWSTTRGYIMDYNRDGIIDIVERKSWLDDRYVVYFGERDFENDSIRFTPSSENTPSPVIKGSELDLEQDVDFTQFTEIVKVWTAPIAGTVNITDSLWFTGASNDGVRYAIQKSIQTGDTSSSSSFLTSFEPVTSYKKFTHLGISVQQGEKIFFRINPNADGYEDEIQHNPAVTYANKSAVDPNGVDFY
ncbi:MAG: SpvB/TcaC N-terminal domain-containing protein, partial [Schleiferiaceae bacterium]|nr:SpvB/TcaC N-terminal domain-containing protein [Schleiferiaceae bacterium]